MDLGEALRLKVGDEKPRVEKREVDLGDLLAKRVTAVKSPKSIPEIQRICEIPIKYPLTEEEIEAVQRRHVKATAPLDFKLQRVQAEALFDFERGKTMFGPIEVGGGKTLISLRIVGMATEAGMKKTMLVVPPNVIDQLVGHDIAWARARVPIGCTFHVLAGLPRSQRRQMAKTASRGCFIMPYSLFSTADTDELLHLIQPELIVLDEAHNVSNIRTARTRRLREYVRSHNPLVVAMSGTMTKRSIQDYAHLMRMCLGRGSVLPLEAQIVSDWAGVLDASWQQTYENERKAGTGPLRPLVSWNNNNFPEDPCEYSQEGFRKAYQNRLLTCPGVVSSPADSLGCSLVITNEKVAADGRPGAEDLQHFIDQVNTEWVAPNGDEIEWAIHKFKWNYELSSGFYNDLYWPVPERVAEKHNCSLAVAEERLERARSHHIALQNYHRELRNWLRYHQVPHCDTPMLVGNEMAKHGPRVVGQGLYKAWKHAKDLEFDGMPEREGKPVRVCDYKIHAAIRWMKQRKKGIVWFLHRGLGEWLHDEARRHGLDVEYCPAGMAANRYLTDPKAAELTKNKFLICSIRAHGTAKNLQYMDDALFLQFPRPEDQAQQTLGRTHRQGQTSDEVKFTTLISNEIDEISLSATLNDSVYVWETTRSKRKVLFAVWDPMPVVHGESVLLRAGTQAKRLNVVQRKILESRFSPVDARTA